MSRVAAFFLVLPLIGVIALYVLEFRWFDRTIDMRSLALYALAIGAAAGTTLGWRLSRQGRNSVEKVQLYIFCIVTCTLFAPFLASLSNRLLSPYPARPRPVEFFDEQAYLSDRFGLTKGEQIEPSGYYTFFYYQGRLRRVKSRKPLLPGTEKGEMAELYMKRGLWGFEVVLH